MKPDPVHWFLAGKQDIRSSFYLEDVATEFDIQGLELDWACVTWDADFRHSSSGWRHHAFRGNKWQNVKNENRKLYQKNAYRVLLTRARQGMIICVPHGDADDPTRNPEFYDSTFEYLKATGLELIDQPPLFAFVYYGVRTRMSKLIESLDELKSLAADGPIPCTIILNEFSQVHTAISYFSDGFPTTERKDVFDYKWDVFQGSGDVYLEIANDEELAETTHVVSAINLRSLYLN